MTRKAVHIYESEDPQGMHDQDILDHAEALKNEHEKGSTVEGEAVRGLRAGTVEGFKTWIERMRGEAQRRLREVEQQLTAAEAFAALSKEEQNKVPLGQRGLRVSYAREFKQQLASAIASFEKELESAERALLAEASRQISEE